MYIEVGDYFKTNTHIYNTDKEYLIVKVVNLPICEGAYCRVLNDEMFDDTFEYFFTKKQLMFKDEYGNKDFTFACNWIGDELALEFFEDEEDYVETTSTCDCLEDMFGKYDEMSSPYIVDFELEKPKPTKLTFTEKVIEIPFKNITTIFQEENSIVFVYKNSYGEEDCYETEEWKTIAEFLEWYANN